jgi:hypothetical protein
MPGIWTHGIWTVKQGREDEFVAGWRELVEIGLRHGADDPTLLRDRERANVFRSFGRWPDLGAVQRFRDEITPRVGAMNELIESAEVVTLDEVYPDE